MMSVRFAETVHPAITIMPLLVKAAKDFSGAQSTERNRYSGLVMSKAVVIYCRHNGHYIILNDVTRGIVITPMTLR